MAACTPQGSKLLYGFKRLTRFDTGLGAQLPEAYKKFWKEWKVAKPTAVHYIPKEGRWERDEVTGQIRPIQNVPIPVIDPVEANQGLWGGEGIVKGFQKRNPLTRRVPHYWVPTLRRSVVYSHVLNQYMSVTVTDRAIDLINESHGLDHYLLKTPACDLRSTLALGLKRRILQALQAGCPDLANDPKKQEEILKEYNVYLKQYTPEEIEWYGLTYEQAILKLQEKIRAENPIIPHKIIFKEKLIEEWRKRKLIEGESESANEKDISSQIRETTSWFAKINPFGKKQET